jgi:hypothetical protein
MLLAQTDSLVAAMAETLHRQTTMIPMTPAS